MFYNETLELFSIIRSMDNDILKCLPSYKVTNEGREFQYAASGSEINTNNFHFFSLEWITTKEEEPKQSTPITVAGNPTTISGIFLSTYNSSSTEYINKVHVTVSKDFMRLISVEWSMNYNNNNMIYPQAMISSSKSFKSPDLEMMKALYLNDKKVLINGVLYDPEENANAFTDDISGDKPYSVLQVIDLQEKFLWQ